MLIDFFKLFSFIYLPVSAVILVFSVTKGKTYFLSALIPWLLITLTGLQNAVTTFLTFRKKFTLFYGFFLGGVLFRLILIAVVSFIVLKFTNLDLYYYLITLSLYYIFIQVLEVYFISKTFKGKKLAEEK